MKTTLRQLRKIIREEVRRVDRKRRINENIPYTVDGNNLKVISRETLQKHAPQAFALAQDDSIETPDLAGGIWFMNKKPEVVVPFSEEDEEQWTETNEPELAEWIAEFWDSFAIQGVVILAGTLDDEYGWVWDNSTNVWQSYSY